MSIGVAIGLGVLSAANSIYQNHKRNQQVDRANDINENAAQLSYDAQMKTNDLNYQIFKEQQEYNSPANLKNMYDALGLNGDAIVANQGFTPTAAPVMNAPHMDQVNFQPYEKFNPIDESLNSLITAISSEKMKKEIDSLDKEMAYKEAQTEQCRQSTKLLLQDEVLKDQQISEGDINYLMKCSEYEQLNLQNANYILVNRRLNQTITQEKEIHSKLLRMYDDKHAIDAAEAAIAKFNLDHIKEKFTAEIKEIYSRIRLNISNSQYTDLMSYGKKIANYILESTQNFEIENSKYQSEQEKFKRNKEYYDYVEASKKHDALNPNESDNDLLRYMKNFTSGYSIGLDILTDPIKGIFGGSISKKL